MDGVAHKLYIRAQTLQFYQFKTISTVHILVLLSMWDNEHFHTPTSYNHQLIQTIII